VKSHGLALTKGMQAFGISAARHLNRELGRTGGTVFPDRYHATRLGSPRQVRNCIAYVLNNWRHHNEDRRVTWRLDPFSSAVMFDGWRDRHFIRPPGFVAPLVLEPTTWLLRIGWRKHGLLDPGEVPGGPLRVRQGRSSDSSNSKVCERLRRRRKRVRGAGSAG
jgi:putative transposase